MPKIKIGRWYDVLTIFFLLMIAASFLLGLDPVLNGISFALAVGFVIAVIAVTGLAIALLGWWTIRDGFEEMRHERVGRNAWWWQLFAYAAVIGVFLDGAFAAWNAVHKHIMFSDAVRSIPFAGIPVLMIVAIYPVRWMEQFIRRRYFRAAEPPRGSSTKEGTHVEVGMGSSAHLHDNFGKPIEGVKSDRRTI